MKENPDLLKIKKNKVNFKAQNVELSCPIPTISMHSKSFGVSHAIPAIIRLFFFWFFFLTHLWVKSSWNMSNNNSDDSTDICNHAAVAETHTDAYHKYCQVA